MHDLRVRVGFGACISRKSLNWFTMALQPGTVARAHLLVVRRVNFQKVSSRRDIANLLQYKSMGSEKSDDECSIANVKN